MASVAAMQRPWAVSIIALTFAVCACSGELSIETLSASGESLSSLQVRYSVRSDQLSAVQFDLEYPPSLKIVGAPGPLVSLHGKSMYSVDLSAGRTRFLIAGMNSNPIGDGILVALAATASAEIGPGSYSIALRNAGGSDPEGGESAVTGIDGSLTVGGIAPALPSGMFAHIAAGGGWKTSLSLANVSSAPATVRIMTWNSGGGPLMLPMGLSSQDQVRQASLDLTIPANGSVEVLAHDPDTPSPSVGWAQLYAPAGVVGWATYSVKLPSGQVAESVAPLEVRSPPSFMLPFDNSSGYSAGVALANGSGSSPASVLMIARDHEGRHLLTDLIQLPIRGHLSFAVVEKYLALNGIKGTLEFQNTRVGNIAVLGWRFHPDGVVATIAPVPKQ